MPQPLCLRKLIAVVAAVGLSVSGIVASAGLAQADVPCSITGFTPSTVVVGLSPILQTFHVRVAPTSGTPDPCEILTWGLALEENPDFSEGSPWQLDSEFGDAKVFTDDPTLSAHPITNADAGSRSAFSRVDYISEMEPSSRRSWPGGFHLLRKGSWRAGSRFNAGPEPVKKGRAITIKGTLSRANWDTHKYQVHGFQPVQVQFRTPTGLYSTVKTLESAANGSVKTTVTAQRTGYWRLVYRGNGTSGPVKAAGDRVKVS